MTTAIFCIGIPNSGKSSYGASHFPDYVRLSTDDYIEWFASQVNSTYNEVFESQIKTAHSVMDLVRLFAINNNSLIYWDQTNLTVRTRKQKLNSIPSHYRKIALFFNVPIEVCSERNKQRKGKVIPQRVMLQMQESLAPPTLDEGFSEIIIIK